MRNSHAVFAIVLLGLLLSGSRFAEAQLLPAPPAVTVSAGYSYVRFPKATDLFYDHSGGYVDADVAWRLPTVVPLQLGVGLTGSGYEEQRTVYAPNGGDLYYYDPYDRLYSDTGLIEIEPRLGVPLFTPVGFFAIPRIGAGLLVDSYSIDQQQTYNGNDYIYTHDHTGAAFELRPSIQAGYAFGPAAAGIEASYMYAWGDFGGLGHHAQEFRIGAFLRFGF